MILTGFAGLLAGAFSMAVGEWTSVHSQTQLVQAEIDKEREEIERSPAAEERELAGLFRRRGLSRDLADRVAQEVSSDPDEAWRVHVREELGVDPDEQPSAYVAAGLSFVTSTHPYADVAYGWAMEDRGHFVKLLADPASGALLGAHIIGPDASTLIQPLVQAMSLGTGVAEMARGQYWIHPALTEVVENALLKLRITD